MVHRANPRSLSRFVTTTGENRPMNDDSKSLISQGDLTRRGFVVTSLAAGFALATQPVSAQTITTDTTGLEAGEVKIPVTDGQIPAYRAMPATGGPFPMVLVVQEIFGVHEHIKDLCRRLAKLGYLAIATELYARQGDVSKIKDFREIISKVVSKVPDAQVMSDLDATVAWAKESSKADTAKLGITGFCWGGRIVWLYSAHNPNLKAGVAWYGRLVGQPDELHPKNPIDLVGRPQGPRARALRRRRSGNPGRVRGKDAGGARRRLGRPPRSSSTLIRRTPSSPITAPATARTGRRTAGSGCWSGSRNMGLPEFFSLPLAPWRTTHAALRSIPCIFCSCSREWRFRAGPRAAFSRPIARARAIGRHRASRGPRRPRR